MKLLFDTHAFVWWDIESQKLSARVLAACRDPENTLLLSVASVWEIQIKLGIGKLKLTDTLDQVVMKQQGNGIILLPIDLPHVIALDSLPMHHKDPFDRLLLAQTKVEGAHLITADTQMPQYDVPIFW